MERLNVVLDTLERGDILMIAQEDDCRWIRDAKAEIERLRAAVVTSRREALEEAAKVADRRADYWDSKDDGVEMAPMVAGAACAGVAIAIRTLSPIDAPPSIYDGLVDPADYANEVQGRIIVERVTALDE